jgi:hypothetical protein
MADTWIPAVGFTPWGKSYPRDVVFVVLHHSGGVAAGDIPTLTTGGKVSCHRYVTRDGQRYQFVRDDDIAWTCGVLPAFERQPHPMGSRWAGDENRPSFNIEMENDGRSPFTEQQYNAAADWTADWVRRYGVPFDRRHILGHRELTTHALHQDPNDTWDWNRFMQLVGARLGASPAHQDYPIQGDPTITQARFRDVLAATPRSPVTDQADQAYAICRQFGVNPAVALAFFIKESTKGTDGIAVQTLNWGNLIRPWDPNRATGQTIRAFGHDFPVYKSWLDGLADYCDLITSERGPFAGEKRNTVRSLIPRYAPPSENNTGLYIQQTITRIASWIESAPPPPPPPPPVTYTDFALQEAPTISRDLFAQTLTRFGSPAAPAADDCFNICVANGVNPAMALAFFIKVSQCGTVYPAGGSPDQHNCGNLRDPNSGFTPLLSFPTWQQGLVYWCTRLTTVYKNNGWTTLSTIVPRYFSGISGDPQSIAAELSTLIAAWKAIFDQGGGFTPGPPGGGRYPAL